MKYRVGLFYYIPKIKIHKQFVVFTFSSRPGNHFELLTIEPSIFFSQTDLQHTWMYESDLSIFNPFCFYPIAFEEDERGNIIKFQYFTEKFNKRKSLSIKLINPEKWDNALCSFSINDEVVNIDYHTISVNDKVVNIDNSNFRYFYEFPTTEFSFYLVFLNIWYQHEIIENELNTNQYDYTIIKNALMYIENFDLEEFLSTMSVEIKESFRCRPGKDDHYYVDKVKLFSDTRIETDKYLKSICNSGIETIHHDWGYTSAYNMALPNIKTGFLEGDELEQEKNKIRNCYDHYKHLAKIIYSSEKKINPFIIRECKKKIEFLKMTYMYTALVSVCNSFEFQQISKILFKCKYDISKESAEEVIYQLNKYLLNKYLEDCKVLLF